MDFLDWMTAIMAVIVPFAALMFPLNPYKDRGLQEHERG
jgi:hypothetical protein